MEDTGNVRKDCPSLNHLFVDDRHRLSLIGGDSEKVHMITFQRTLECPPGPMQRLRFAATGDRLFALVGDRLLVWDTQSWTQGSAILLPPGDWISFALFPDTSLFALGGYSQIAVYERATGACRWRHPIRGPRFLPSWEVWDLTFSPDGAYLAAVAEKHLRVWSTKSWETVWKRVHTTSGIHAVAWRSDGAYLATGDDFFVRVWPLVINHTSPTISPRPHKWGLGYFKYGVRDLAFFHEEIWTAGDEGIRRWSIKDYQQVGTVIESPPQYTFALSPDAGFLAIAGEGNTIHIYHVRP